MHYRLLGFPNILPDPSISSKAKPSIAKQIQAFKKMLRAVVCRCMEGSDDLKYFKPGPRGLLALQGLAIAGDHATLNCNFFIDAKRRDQLAMHVVKASRRISKCKATSFCEGSCSLTKIPFKGVTVCGPNLGYTSKHAHERQSVSPVPHGNATCPINVDSLQCPKNRHAE